MENSLKELITLSTENGVITEDRKILIYSKAAEQGVSKVEVDVYLESALRKNIENKKSITISRNFQGVWYIIAAILDFIVAAYAFVADWGEMFLVCILSGLFLLLWGLHTLNALNKKSMLIFVKSPITHSVILIGSYFIGIDMGYFFLMQIVFSIIIPYFLFRQLKFQKARYFFEVITVLILLAGILSYFTETIESLYIVTNAISRTNYPTLFLLILVLSLELFSVHYSSKLNETLSKIFNRFNRIHAIILAGIILLYNLLVSS